MICIQCGFFATVFIIVVLLFTPETVNSEPLRINIADFSSQQPGLPLPNHWHPLTFRKIPGHTHYELVPDDDVIVVKATSQSAASGLVRKVSINLKEHPIIHWRWKIDRLIEKSDATEKDGDDYPARIYITFAYEPDRVGMFRKIKYKLGRKLFGDIPIAAINYIWEPRLPVNTIINNPYTSLTKMIVIQSGNARVGEWLSEQRNVYQDYIKAFNEEPPLVNGVAIMTDTDNTAGQATAWYGDIYFINEP